MFLQVLYIKNLSSSVKETDLVSVFSNFDSGAEKRLVYRLMTGRMRGQAFITFPSEFIYNSIISLSI